MVVIRKDTTLKAKKLAQQKQILPGWEAENRNQDLKKKVFYILCACCFLYTMLKNINEHLIVLVNAGIGPERPERFIDSFGIY